MQFKQQLIPGKLLKRYKRFLADVELEDGQVITAHCPNSGSMKTCATRGWEVRLSRSSNKHRKYPYTWEMVNNGRCWIGINTGVPNIIVAEALADRKIPELADFITLNREVRYGVNSRIDILLQGGSKTCYIEVKNVTLVEDDDIFYFPDAVTERGTKHLSELIRVVEQGYRAAMFYVIQRDDGRIFKPAKHIDGKYTEMLQKAVKNGVEIFAYMASVSPEQIYLEHPVPRDLD